MIITRKQLEVYSNFIEMAVDNDSTVDFPGNSASFKFKQKIISKTGNDGTENVEIMVPLKHLSNFWRTFAIQKSIVKLFLF